MKQKTFCANMNHGRSNVSINYCPMCGEPFKSAVKVSCDETFHSGQRKNRNNYCNKCGKKLLT